MSLIKQSVTAQLENNMSLIKQVVTAQLEARQLKEHVGAIAKELNTTPLELTEAATHVLANLSSKVGQGAVPVAMSGASMAAFLAGIDYLITALPRVRNPEQAQKVNSLLANVRIGQDGYVSTNAAQIAQLGANQPALIQQYRTLVDTYLTSVEAGKPAGDELLNTINKLNIGLSRLHAQTVQPARTNQFAA